MVLVVSSVRIAAVIDAFGSMATSHSLLWVSQSITPGSVSDRRCGGIGLAMNSSG